MIEQLPKHIIQSIIDMADDSPDWVDISEDLELEGFAISPQQCESIFSQYSEYMLEDCDVTDDVNMSALELDTTIPYISKRMKKIQFIDIETSLITAKVFSTGKQTVKADQVISSTRVLTVAGGSFYDLYNYGEDGIWGYSNHHDNKRFKKDPLDDTYVLRKVWDILDNADVIVAHNARFDKSWLLGRFLEKGWKLPSRFDVVCTYRYLHDFNMTSKKLGKLSESLIGTNKIESGLKLWMRCSNGDVDAFTAMLKYNCGDIYDTLFQVYLRTCQYAPHMAIDMSNPNIQVPQCRVTGDLLERCNDTYYNPTNGLEYYKYFNRKNGLTYVDRYNTRSKKANLGYIKHFR